MSGTPVEVDKLFDQPAHRRWWLLVKALECTTFDLALELARAAEDFVTPAIANEIESSSLAVGSSVAAVMPYSNHECSKHAEVKAGVTLNQQKHTTLPVTPDQREELLNRLAGGAKNGELASEFGLTPKQVQGIRMGAAREITIRRSSVERSQDQSATVTASVDEVVLYLRQQDDVVVRDQDGGFLVNGRFHLGRSELVAKANCMRRRQNKPLFELYGTQQ